MIESICGNIQLTQYARNVCMHEGRGMGYFNNAKLCSPSFLKYLRLEMVHKVTSKTIDIRVNYGFQCIQDYTVTALADREEVRRGYNTSAGDVFVRASVCPRQYTFTARACSLVGCSNESAPETYDIPDGE